ncbi:MAG: aminotransferase class I/II-fold pyridoxal phosphate-dependent enzyme, partial [Chloroflexota bacterium]
GDPDQFGPGEDQRDPAPFLAWNAGIRQEAGQGAASGRAQAVETVARLGEANGQLTGQLGCVQLDLDRGAGRLVGAVGFDPLRFERLFSSGMAAITTTLLSLLSSGAHVIHTDDCYRHSRYFLTKFLKRYGVESTQVPMGDYEALEAAIRPNTKVILSESPTNPYLRVLDLERVTAIAKKHRLKTVIDSTFATPINQCPLEFGVDFVVHSATKYLGGHNDLLAGVVVGSDYMIGGVKEAQAMLGDVSDPHTAYLLLRGLKTLALRVQQQNDTALKIAHFLEKHPTVHKVYYPGLPSHPDHEIASQQMRGFGGVISFELETDFEGTGRFIDQLQIPYIGPSLGGVESLIEQVALVSYYGLSTEERAEIGISDGLIRLAVGIEAADDLLTDLAQALDKTFETETLFQTDLTNGQVIPAVIRRQRAADY